jgi:hypothetical protein
MAEPPNIEQLREARSQVGGRAGNSCLCGAHFLVRQEVVEAADFLLSVLDEGGRLVVEQPCEHGSAVRHRISKALPPSGPVMCPGGSRRVVWPTDKEES